jgi:uncharacterized SAM-binding protein YcdF (DUF218 family)
MNASENPVSEELAGDLFRRLLQNDVHAAAQLRRRRLDQVAAVRSAIASIPRIDDRDPEPLEFAPVAGHNGGAVRMSDRSHHQVEGRCRQSDLVASSDRVLHAARLFRADKVKRILVSGGNIPWLPGERPEAELIREFLVEWGVPSGSIEIAGASRNTYENALEIRSMRELQPFVSALLVNSATHMPRAMAVFLRAGIPMTAATTDIEVVTPGPWTLLRCLPNADALVMTTTAMREWIGFWVYRARGYL